MTNASSDSAATASMRSTKLKGVNERVWTLEDLAPGPETDTGEAEFQNLSAEDLRLVFQKIESHMPLHSPTQSLLQPF